MKTFIAALTVMFASIIAVAQPAEAKQPKRTPVRAAPSLCDNYATLSQEELLRALKEATRSGATGWPGADTVCMGGPQVEAQAPRLHKPERMQTAD